MGIQNHKPATGAAVAETTLWLRNASFGYRGVTVLPDISVSLKPGDALALIGPNGSGKSTLLTGIAGLTELTGGELRVLGAPVRESRSRIALLAQQDTRNKAMPVTVEQVVAMGLYPSLGAFGVIRGVHRKKIATALAEVRLQELAKTQFSELSGGQQQRAILARALVANPSLLLLDEPFNGLDRPNREILLDIIRRICAAGCAVVVSTHDLEIARVACSHVMLLDKRQVACDTTERALTLENVAATFHDTTVEIDGHALTTRHESADHVHHTHTGRSDSTCPDSAQFKQSGSA